MLLTYPVHVLYTFAMNETMKEIKRQADHGIDSKQMDAHQLRKVLINIANLAAAELNGKQGKLI